MASRVCWAMLVGWSAWSLYAAYLAATGQRVPGTESPMSGPLPGPYRHTLLLAIFLGWLAVAAVLALFARNLRPRRRGR